jgi:hypothetical protein
VGFPLQSLTRNAVCVLIVCVLAGCEGYKFSIVTVVSETDEQPIANAQVDFIKKSGEVLRTLHTDSLGQVPFDSGFTGMMFGGPKFRYRISKDGFVELSGAEKWPEPIKRLKPL